MQSLGIARSHLRLTVRKESCLRSAREEDVPGSEAGRREPITNHQLRGRGES